MTRCRWGSVRVEIVLADHFPHVFAEMLCFAETEKPGVLRVGKSAHEVAIEVHDHRRDVLGHQMKLHLARAQRRARRDRAPTCSARQSGEAGRLPGHARKRDYVALIAFSHRFTHDSGVEFAMVDTAGVDDKPARRHALEPVNEAGSPGDGRRRGTPDTEVSEATSVAPCVPGI